jgi:DASH complex subunit ASK1
VVLMIIAREASKQIVEDLLLTAGGDIDEDLPEEYSPSIIMKGNQFQDDTF